MVRNQSFDTFDRKLTHKKPSPRLRKKNTSKKKESPGFFFNQPFLASFRLAFSTIEMEIAERNPTSNLRDR